MDALAQEYGTDDEQNGEPSNKYDLTEEQRKAAYQDDLEEEVKNYTASRFIVKYTDEQSVPQFSDGGKNNNNKNDGNDSSGSKEGPSIDAEKITSAGIESSRKFEGKDFEKFAIVNTNSSMNKEAFQTVMDAAGLGENIEYIQPDYEMAVSSDAFISQQWGLEARISMKPER